MNILLMLLPLLLQLLQALLHRKRLGGALSDREKTKLNHFIFSAREVESAAVSLGCVPGGIEDADHHAEPMA